MCDGGQKQQGFCLKRGKGKWLKNKRELGKEYEAAVRRILEKRGYRILRENYRCPIGEIDLIARDGKTLVFVEVNTGAANGAVCRRRQYRLVNKGGSAGQPAGI